jgi:hypothetical protein
MVLGLPSLFKTKKSPLCYALYIGLDADSFSLPLLFRIDRKTKQIKPMIVYSITTSVVLSREQEWVEWMQEKHIPDCMSTGYFLDFNFQKLLDPQPEPGSATYNVQYILGSFSDYHYYIKEEAPALRQAHEDQFGPHALSFRTVLKRIESKPEDQ